MTNIASLKSLLIPSKETEVEFPGLPGFKVSLAYLSRESLAKIRKNSTKVTFKNGRTSDSFNDELFLKLYVEATIKGWSGLTYEYLQELALVDIGTADPKAELPFSTENALDLMKASTSFDEFISEIVNDLQNFTKSSSKTSETQ